MDSAFLICEENWKVGYLKPKHLTIALAVKPVDKMI